jgi:hypothetical protein
MFCKPLGAAAKEELVHFLHHGTISDKRCDRIMENYMEIYQHLKPDVMLESMKVFRIA